MKSKETLKAALGIILGLALMQGCKKKDKSDDDSDNDGSSVFSGGGSVGDGTSLGAVYPGELALAVFTDG